MKEFVTGVWRTYKVFFFSGKVKSHNNIDFIEITIDDSGNFTLLNSQNRRKAINYKAEQWQLVTLKNRRYIYLGKKQTFEIITLEREDLVLLDVVKGEKLFFSKMSSWQERISPIHLSTKHLKSNQTDLS